MATGDLTREQMQAFADGMLEAYNRHDVEGMLERLTADVVWREPALPETARGTQAVRASLQDTFNAFPDAQVLRDDFMVYPDPEGQSLVVTWTATATMTRALQNGVPPTGRSFRMSGANLARFRGGLVSEYTYYYDSLQLMQQLGLLPRSTGLGFKAIVLADVMAGRARKVLQRH